MKHVQHIFSALTALRGVTFGVLMVLLVGTMGCEQRSGGPTDVSVPEEGPDQVSWEARFALSEGGSRRAEIIAGQMEHYSRDDSSYAVLRSPPDSADVASDRRVTAYLFTPEGDSSATIRADRMLYFDQEGRFEAYDNVVVTTPTDRRLESEHLVWEETRRKIRTPGFVRITTPSEYVEGTGLVADEDLETYQLGRFSARVTLDEEEGS